MDLLYGRKRSLSKFKVLEIIRQIEYDERVHKLESRERMKTVRLR